MRDDDLGPEGFTTRAIPAARRGGFDRRVTETLVAEAIERWSELKRRYEALRTEVDRAGGLDRLTRDLRAVGEEVTRVLEAAREAAEGMRTRAQEEAAAVVAAAEERRGEAVREADEQAFHLRQDAWETGMQLLEAVRETSAAIIAEAQDDALLIRAEAERESHRRLVVTRKEQDDMVRSTRYELDRLVAQARDLATEILEAAHADEAAIAPTPGQEQRRREVLDEIDRLRTLAGIEEVAVLPADPAPPRPREDRPRRPGREVDPGLGDLSDALAADVEQLGGSRGATGPGSLPADRAGDQGLGDDVGTLFEALRTTAEVEVVERPPAPDPVVFHQRVVVPAFNMGVRDLKRRIADLQANAQEALRTTGWTPEARALMAELSPALDHAVQRAASGGIDAARAMAGIEVEGPLGSDRARRLTAMMAQELTSQLRAAGSGEGSVDEAAARMSRVFRSWRTDEIERWVRAILDAAYHDELIAALADGGLAAVRGVADGALCAECPAAGGATWDPAGDPPEGTRLPPAHLGCACTIAPG